MVVIGSGISEGKISLGISLILEFVVLIFVFCFWFVNGFSLFGIVGYF